MRRNIDLVGTLWPRIQQKRELGAVVVAVERKVHALLQRHLSPAELRRALDRLVAEALPEEREIAEMARRLVIHAGQDAVAGSDAMGRRQWLTLWAMQLRTLTPSLALFAVAESVLGTVAVGGAVGAVTGHPPAALQHAALPVSAAVTALSAGVGLWGAAEAAAGDGELLRGPPLALLGETYRQMLRILQGALTRAHSPAMATGMASAFVAKASGLADGDTDAFVRGASVAAAVTGFRLCWSLISPPDLDGPGDQGPDDTTPEDPGPRPGTDEELQLSSR